MRLWLVYILFCLPFLGNTQVVVYQEVVEGGVTVGGVNFGATFGTLNFSVFVEPNSSIKKAYLIVGADGTPEDLTITLNGNNHHFDETTVATEGYLSFFTSPPTSSMHMLDVTNYVNPNVTNYTIYVPIQDFLSQNYFTQFFLAIVYENSSLPKTAIEIVLNDKDVSATINYQLLDLIPINTSNSVGYSLFGRHFCDTIQDGTFIKVNGNLIGLVGGEDANSPALCTGVGGNFYYQNNTLFGLDDDTPDIFMSGTDALANIQSYVSNNTQLDLNFDYQTPGNINGGLSNPVMAVILAYTTPCDTFTVQTPNDTTVCQGTQLQLSASGGNPTSTSTTGYAWLPATGLSCTDCPNPVFSADSSMFYTVRVWNNDSCSVVRPLKINVRKAPLWDTLELSASVCGASTGSAALYAFPDNSVVQTWTEVGGSTQSSSNFQNLSGGFHTFYFTDTNGCQSADTTIFIQTTNPTLAQFVATPQSGAAPLNVSFANTSQNATDFLWSVNGAPQGNALPSYVFDTSGTYTVQLAAWQNDPACADTFSLQIAVFDSLIVQIPNVFSPNGDGVNELFIVSANQDVAYDFTIFNRWGNAMTQGKGKILQGTPASLWDGKDATDGSYFLKIEFEQLDGTKMNYQGVFQLVR